MLAFDRYWSNLLLLLDRPTRIRNWTAFGTFTTRRGKTNDFVAQAYRSCTEDTKRHIDRGYPPPNPNLWIVCTRIEVERFTYVTRQQFHECYARWRKYKNAGISREDFGGSK